MQSTIPCLVFNSGGEEAIKFYVSVVPNSRIVDLIHGQAGGPVTEGQPLHARSELDGQPYDAFDGGPSLTFSEAVSLPMTCETKQETDDLLARLTAYGWEPRPSGWLK